MTDKEILEYMKERFDQVSTSIDKMEKGIDKRLGGIEADVKILTDYRSKTEGSLSAMKFTIGIGFTAMSFILYLVTIYLKHK